MLFTAQQQQQVFTKSTKWTSRR